MKSRSSRVLAWLGLVLFAGLALGSCGKKEKLGGPAMWHMSDADSEIYLFGTFHLLPNDLDWQRADMVKAFDNSSILILEADVMGAAPGDVVNLIKQYAVAPPDKPLSSRLTPEQLAQLKTAAAKFNLDTAMLDPYQPWYAATILSLKFAESRGLSAGEGAEGKLVKAAETGKKPLAYLESIQQQIQFMAGLPEQTQIELLAATLKDLTNSDQTIADMQTAWVKGDTKAMSALFDPSIKDIPDLYKVLILERNRRWTDEIEKLMAGSGKAFIAVGAGHLVGNDSVVAMLRDRGFTVEGP